MNITCPHCGVTGTARESYRGRRIRCPKCDETFLAEPSDRKELTEDTLHEPLETINIECPHCGTDGVVDTSFLGQKIRCPKCHWRFIAGQPEISPAMVHAEEEPVDPMIELDLDSIDSEVTALSETAPESETLETADAFTFESESEEEETGKVFAEEDVFTESLSQEEEECEIAAAELVGAGVAAGTGTVVAGAFDSSESLSDENEQVDLPAAAYEKPETEEVDNTRWTISWALSKAWRRTRGAKLVIWLQTLPLLLLGIIFSEVFKGTTGGMFSLLRDGAAVDSSIFTSGFIFSSFLLSIIWALIDICFMGGFVFTGVRRAAGERTSVSMLGRGFKEFRRLVGASFLISLFVGIGLLLFILPGIYFFIAYSMTFPLIVEQRLRVSEAMRKSRKAVNKVWFKVFALFVVMKVLFIISVILFGIPLIWIWPLSWVLLGVIYQALFSERVIA